MINNTVSLKTAKIKKWFDREIAEKLSIKDQLFKKFKSSRLNIDWEIYKEARNDIQRTIKEKKKQYLEKKLSENKRTLANFKITGATEQKEFCFEYMFKKQKWLII